MEIELLIKKLEKIWSKHGIKTAKPHEKLWIDDFAQKNNIYFPKDFLYFYQTLNGFGMNGSWHDENGFHFWPLQNFERHLHTNLFIFSDYLINSWDYAIDLSNTQTQGSVYRVETADGIPKKICATFTEFLKLYISDNDLLYPA